MAVRSQDTRYYVGRGIFLTCHVYVERRYYYRTVSVETRRFFLQLPITPYRRHDDTFGYCAPSLISNRYTNKHKYLSTCSTTRARADACSLISTNGIDRGTPPLPLPLPPPPLTTSLRLCCHVLSAPYSQRPGLTGDKYFTSTLGPASCQTPA